MARRAPPSVACDWLRRDRLGQARDLRPARDEAVVGDRLLRAPFCLRDLEEAVGELARRIAERAEPRVELGRRRLAALVRARARGTGRPPTRWRGGRSPGPSLAAARSRRDQGDLVRSARDDSRLDQRVDRDALARGRAGRLRRTLEARSRAPRTRSRPSGCRGSRSPSCSSRTSPSVRLISARASCDAQPVSRRSRRRAVPAVDLHPGADDRLREIDWRDVGLSAARLPPPRARSQQAREIGRVIRARPAVVAGRPGRRMSPARSCLRRSCAPTPSRGWATCRQSSGPRRSSRSRIASHPGAIPRRCPSALCSLKAYTTSIGASATLRWREVCERLDEPIDEVALRGLSDRRHAGWAARRVLRLSAWRPSRRGPGTLREALVGARRRSSPTDRRTRSGRSRADRWRQDALASRRPPMAVSVELTTPVRLPPRKGPAPQSRRHDLRPRRPRSRQRGSPRGSPRSSGCRVRPKALPWPSRVRRVPPDAHARRRPARASRDRDRGGRRWHLRSSWSPPIRLRRHSLSHHLVPVENSRASQLPWRVEVRLCGEAEHGRRKTTVDCWAAKLGDIIWAADRSAALFLAGVGGAVASLRPRPAASTTAVMRKPSPTWSAPFAARYVSVRRDPRSRCMRSLPLVPSSARQAERPLRPPTETRARPSRDSSARSTARRPSLREITMTSRGGCRCRMPGSGNGRFGTRSTR